ITPPLEDVSASEVSLRGIAGLVQRRRQRKIAKHESKRTVAEEKASVMEERPELYLTPQKQKELSDAKEKLENITVARQSNNERAENARAKGVKPHLIVHMDESVLAGPQKAVEKLDPATKHRTKAKKWANKSVKTKGRNESLVERKKEAKRVKARR